MTSWQQVQVQLSEACDEGWRVSRFAVPRGVLEREGPLSYFAAHLRFSPEQPVDLGRLDAAVSQPLTTYLKTGAIAAGAEAAAALDYAADAFLLQRLKAQLQSVGDAGERCARFQCLNCKAFVPEEARAELCRFKPFRRLLAGRLVCSRCDLTGSDCHCHCNFRHVFENEPPPPLQRLGQP